MARDAARESVRFHASVDELFDWLKDAGKAFVEGAFPGHLSTPYALNESEHVASFTIAGGPRVGSIQIRYRVVPASSAQERESVDVYAYAEWDRPRFLADSVGAGSLINTAKWGLWNRAAQTFERVGAE